MTGLLVDRLPRNAMMAVVIQASTTSRFAPEETLVSELLDGIAGHRWINIRVPHGFSVESLWGEEKASWFPEGTHHVEVVAKLEVPVVFHARNNRATVADRDNLDQLRAWIEAACAEAPARIRLRDWRVLPERDPAPRKPDEPDQVWQVTAVFEFP